MTLHFCLLILGFAILMGGAEFLIKGATSLASAMGIPALVVGLTVVAFGTSAPELAVSVNAAMTGNANVAVGNVVGSNVCNIFLIIGLSAILARVEIHHSVRKKEMPLMLGALAAMWLTSLDGTISHLEGIFLFIGIVLYLGLSYLQIKLKPGHASREEIEEEVLEQGTETRVHLCVAYILAGLIAMVFGSEWIVNSASALARSFHVSDLVIGVTVVAFGTSLPELATTIVAAKKGQADLAVGNAVGSNLFNVLCVLGITAMLRPLVVDSQALQIDIPIMFVGCFMIWILMLVRPTFGKLEGILMALAYCVYIVLCFTGMETKLLGG